MVSASLKRLPPPALRRILRAFGCDVSAAMIAVGAVSAGGRGPDLQSTYRLRAGMDVTEAGPPAMDRSFEERFAVNDDFMPDVLVAEPGEVLGDPKLLIGGTSALLAAGLVFHKPRLTRTSAEITAALAAATVAATAVKVVSDRTRPNGHNDYSFPSGHSTGAFAVATVLNREFGGWVGPIAYGIATTIGFSRTSDRYHYLSDVVAGAVLGHFIGKYVTRRSAREEVAR